MLDMKLGDTQLILAQCRAHGVLRNQAAYILATAFWESARTMKPVREAFWLSEQWRKANLRYYPWYGRGFVQLTWEENYIRAGQKLGCDLTTDPDEAMRPDIAADVLVIGMLEGWFTGKKLPDYITLGRSDFHGARRIVNGTDKAKEIANIARDYDAELKRSGYGEDDMAPIIHDDPQEAPAARISPQRGIAAAVVALFALGAAKGQEIIAWINGLFGG